MHIPLQKSVRSHLLGPFELGAAATVPAWTFGDEWAREKFGRQWRSTMVPGFYVGPVTRAAKKKPQTAFFVWDDGDDPIPVVTALANAGKGFTYFYVWWVLTFCVWWGVPASVRSNGVCTRARTGEPCVSE